MDAFSQIVPKRNSRNTDENRGFWKLSKVERFENALFLACPGENGDLKTVGDEKLKALHTVTVASISVSRRFSVDSEWERIRVEGKMREYAKKSRLEASVSD